MEFDLVAYPKKRHSTDNKTTYVMVGLGVFMLLAMIQITQWDKHAFSVIPLQTSILFGAADANDYAEYSKICMERRKYDCALENLEQQTKLDPSQMEARLTLGLMQIKMQKNQAAIQTLEGYLNDGGLEPRAQFELAKAYSQAGETKKALHLFTQLLRSKSGVFQVTVTREYVHTLIQAKYWTKAKRVIERARRKSLSHNAFMTAEYKDLIKKMSGRHVASQ